jgi:hypothetical protein
MRQFYILTLHPHAREVFNFIIEHKLKLEVHLNRTRFWIPEGSILTEFILRHGDSCPQVDSDADLITGLPNV